MVNWKTPDSAERLFAAIIAAHPGLKLDYQAMAIMFGLGATYDAIEGRFRRYRKMAEDLKSEARSRGITDIPRGRNTSSGGATTPRTPRGPRSGVAKTPSSGRSRKGGVANHLASPSKRGSTQKPGMGIMDAIFLDDESNNIPAPPKFEDPKVKNELLAMFPNTGDGDLGIVEAPASASSVASTATTVKIDTPPETSFTTSFSDVKFEDRVQPGFVDDFPVPPASSSFAHSTCATASPMGATHDVFSMPPVYFPNIPGGYHDDINNLDDMYGGAA